MTLKKKILMGYGVLFILLSVVITWAIVNIIYLSDATEAILSENYRSILAAKNMVHSLEAQENDLYHVILKKNDEIFLENGNSTNQEKLFEELRENDSNFIQWLSRAKDNVTIEGEQPLVDKIENLYGNYRAQLFPVNMMHITDRDLNENILPLLRDIHHACNDLYSLNEGVMYSAKDQAGAIAARAVWSTSIVAASALILAMVFSMVLAERLVRPLKRFIEASRIISAGDYTVQVPMQTNDELGILAGEFNEMVSKLKKYHELNIEHMIAEKRKVEAILTSIEDGMIVFDPDLKVTGINPAARGIFELEFSDYSSLIFEDFIQDQRVKEIMEHAVRTGKKPSVADEDRVIAVKKNEETRHFLFSVTVTRNRGGNISGIVLLLRDVTYLKEVERTKSEFIMAASHELRTPLTSLGMSMDLIQQKISPKLQDQEKEMMDVAIAEIDRMKSLVYELLDLSKLEAGSIELEIERISVHTLFSHVSEIFTSQLRNKHVHLSVNSSEDFLKVDADANKITWVLSNLISNALRYVEKNGNIVLSAKRDNTHAYISVSDDGPGIPMEYQSKIFQKFVRLKKDQNSGSGLGLAICKEIIRAHGGTIWVDSQKDKGSTFTFTIPVERSF